MSTGPWMVMSYMVPPPSDWSQLERPTLGTDSITFPMPDPRIDELEKRLKSLEEKLSALQSKQRKRKAKK